MPFDAAGAVGEPGAGADPGEQRPVSGTPTVRSVAAEAGVSVATVSYVLSGRVGRDAGVKASTADRVRAVAERQGYLPRHRRQNRSGRRTGTVILALHLLSDPWIQTIITEVSSGLRDDGLELLISVDGDWRRALRYQGADAVFIDQVDESPAGRREISRLVRRGERLIILSASLPVRGYDVINLEDSDGMRMATDYLVERYRDVAMLASPPGSDFAERRLQSFREGAGSAVVREDWVQTCDFSRQAALRATHRLLDTPQRPRAILCSSDFLAMTVIDGARLLGLSVPEDVAVLGTSNSLAGRALSPGLTSAAPVSFYTTVTDLLRERARGQLYTPASHPQPWIIHRPGSTA